MKFLSPSLKNDKEIIMRAIDYDCWEYVYASNELKNDTEIIRQAVK